MEHEWFCKSHLYHRVVNNDNNVMDEFPNRRLIPLGEGDVGLLEDLVVLYSDARYADLFRHIVMPILRGEEDGYVIAESFTGFSYEYMGAAFCPEGTRTREKELFSTLEDVLLKMYADKSCNYPLSYNISDLINTIRQCDMGIAELKAEGANSKNWDLPF